MLIKSISRVVFASALILAFSACGGDGGPSFDDEATTAETENAADAAAGMMTDISFALNFGSPDVLLAASSSAKRVFAAHPDFGGRLAAGIRTNGITMPGLSFARGTGIQLSAAPGCTIESSGTDGDPFDPYDGNENGIPDDWHLKYTCVTKDSSVAENVLTITFQIEASAKENTSSLHGYSAAMNFTVKQADEHGDGSGVELHTTDVLDIRADEVSQDYKFRAREYSINDGELAEGRVGEERHVDFDPVGAIALGSALPDGELTFSGKQSYGGTGGVSLSFTIKTTDPLVYDASCFDDTEPPFTDGTIVGELNGNSSSARFEINFTACGSYTIDVENTSDMVVVTAGER